MHDDVHRQRRLSRRHTSALSERLHRQHVRDVLHGVECRVRHSIAILKKVTDLPISTWTYLDEPSAVRHLGPMAQDFHASFGLGNDDRTYHSVDAHRVALAVIRALEHVVKQQEQRIERLERENRALGQRLPAFDGRHQVGGGRR
jgi:hypothetical protein